MTDYNIQMKQFNGGDYDNLYPTTLASLVRYISSGSLTSTNIQDVLTELNNTKPYIIKGSYVGTGVNGAGNPNTLTFEKDVDMVIIMNTNGGFGDATYDESRAILYVGQTYDKDRSSTYRTFNYADKTLRWYANNVTAQCNEAGNTYIYLAIVEEDYVPYVGQTWIFTTNRDFIVPITGNYRIELHGGGGGGGGAMYRPWNETYYLGGGGGGSGEVYNNVELTKNTVQSIIIGAGGAVGTNGTDPESGSVTPALAGLQGGTTSFGSYSIAGGLGGEGATTMRYGYGGTGTGSLASNGADGITPEGRTIGGAGGSGGSTYGSYGNGGRGMIEGSNGTSGCVILTYLGG